MVWEPTKFIAVQIYNIAFCKWLPIGYPPPPHLHTVYRCLTPTVNVL